MKYKKTLTNLIIGAMFTSSFLSGELAYNSYKNKIDPKNYTFSEENYCYEYNKDIIDRYNNILIKSSLSGLFLSFGIIGLLGKRKLEELERK